MLTLPVMSRWRGQRYFWQLSCTWNSGCWSCSGNTILLHQGGGGKASSTFSSFTSWIWGGEHVTGQILYSLRRWRQAGKSQVHSFSLSVLYCFSPRRFFLIVFPSECTVFLFPPCFASFSSPFFPHLALLAASDSLAICWPCQSRLV